MSPDPPHVVETERVQGPLTLSETCTWPGAPNWLNHPTRRSPAATGSDRVRVSDGSGLGAEPAAPWMNAGDAAGVVTVRGADCGERSFARSKASTEYVLVVARCVLSASDVVGRPRGWPRGRWGWGVAWTGWWDGDGRRRTPRTSRWRRQEWPSRAGRPRRSR